MTCDDFVKAIEDANDINLDQFKRWYSQAGTPELSISGQYDAAMKTYSLNVTQATPTTPGQPDKQPFHIPLAVGLLDSEGNDLNLKLQGSATESNTIVLEVKDKQHEFVFTNIEQSPVPSVLRGFSAPVKIKMQRSEDELAFLLAHDNDPFNRWDAGQSLALQELLRQIAAHERDEPLPEPVALTDALSVAMSDNTIDKALLSMILTLPSESYIADQCEVVNPNAIYHARLFSRRYLANMLKTQFENLYNAQSSDKPYHFDDREMARRSLKNVCLGYLVETEQTEFYALCEKQFNSADNMTEVQAALSILSQHEVEQRQTALTQFYDKWSGDAQVVEKWLAIQAGSRLPNTLQQVQLLKGHESFSMTNPNKVRALIGSFSRGNPCRFHAIDGSGYQFLADNVLELDDMNPSIAARLVQAMARWRRFDEVRQQLMHDQLQRILDHKGLSKDVYEVVSKSLAD